MIKYFGADVAYGPDCQPLAEDARLTVTFNNGTGVSMTVDEMVDESRLLNIYPVSYDVQPF